MSKTVSDNLFRLIKSLTKAEKRYFKLYTGRYNGSENTNYVTLFNAIDAQKEYDEEKIRKKFRNKAFVKSFPIAKNRLQEVIHRSLDAFHSDHSADSEIKRDLHVVEILFKKNLYEECRRLLAAAKRQAVKYDKPVLLLEILMWEKNLMSVNSYGGVSGEDVEAMRRQDEEALRTIENYSEFWNIKSRFVMQMNRKGNLRDKKELEKFKTIIDHPLLASEEAALSYRSKYFYYHILGTYYFAVADFAKSYEYLKKHTSLIEAHPQMMEEEPNNYVTVLMNLINSCHLIGKKSEIPGYIKTIRDVPGRLPASSREYVEVKVFADSYNVELGLCIEEGRFEEGAKLIPFIEAGLYKFNGRIGKSQKIVLYYNIAVVLFGAGKFNDSLRWINVLMNDRDLELMQDLHCFTRLLNLVVHLELQNDDLLPYILKSTHRYLETRHRLFKFETVFLGFIKKISKLKAGKIATPLYENLKKELEALTNDPYENRAFSYFDFPAWVESKLEKKSFPEIIRKKSERV